MVLDRCHHSGLLGHRSRTSTPAHDFRERKTKIEEAKRERKSVCPNTSLLHPLSYSIDPRRYSRFSPSSSFSFCLSLGRPRSILRSISSIILLIRDRRTPRKEKEEKEVSSSASCTFFLSSLNYCSFLNYLHTLVSRRNDFVDKGARDAEVLAEFVFILVNQYY